MRFFDQLDNIGSKHIIVFVLIYVLISKIPANKLPTGNPLFLTIAIIIVLYAIETPPINKEPFINTNAKNNSDSLDLKNAIKEVLNENFTQPNDDVKTIYPNGMPTREKVINDTVVETKSTKCDCEKVADKAITRFLQQRRLLDNKGMLHYADAYIGDMGFSQIHLDQFIPLGQRGNGAFGPWQSDFHMLNSDRWKPAKEVTSRCKVDNEPIRQPLGMEGTAYIGNWDYSRKVLPPDTINVDFIKTLNS